MLTCVALRCLSNAETQMIKKMLLKGETEIARRKFNEMKLWPADSWAGASDKSTAAGAATSKSLLGNLTGVLAAAAAMVAGPKPLFSIEGDGYMVVTDKRVLFLHYGAVPPRYTCCFLSPSCRRPRLPHRPDDVMAYNHH